MLGLGLRLPTANGGAEVPDNRFRVTLTPSTLSLAQGETGDIAVALTLLAGAAEVAAFSVTGLPPGVTGNFNVLDDSTDGGDATLTLTASGAAVAITLDPFLVVVEAASMTKRAAATVTVELNDFEMALVPDQPAFEIQQGSNETFDIELALLSGIAVTTTSIVVTGLPSGVTADVADQTISTNGGTTTVTLTADPGAAITSAVGFTVTVTAPDAEHSDTGTVAVTEGTGGGSNTADSTIILSDSSLITADAA